MASIFLLIVLLFGLPHLQSTNTEKQDLRCSLRCLRFTRPRGDTHGKCKVFYPLQLNCSTRQFQNVSSLDLSQSNLTQVPSEVFSFFEDLRMLNLAENNITEIESGSFDRLRKLQYLNLSFNNLRKWTVDALSDEGALLSDIDVTGNKGWLPGKQLTHFKKLRIISGVSWNEHCKACLLVKVEANRSLSNFSCQENGPRVQMLISTAGWMWHKQIKYGQAFDFVKLGFWPTCLCAPSCFIHQFNLPLARAQLYIVSRAILCLYATGSVVILLNITLIIFIAFHRRLRNNVAILLICNIAACDVLVGLFSVIYARFNEPRSAVDFMSDTLEGSFKKADVEAHHHLRNAMGTILTCALAAQVCGGFIMTLEKFLKIVFVMRPNLRIEKNCVVLLLIFSWCFSALFAILPVFHVGGMTYLSFTRATPLPSDQYSVEGVHVKVQMGTAAGTQILLVIVQLASIILHLSIYAAAKKSGASLGIKREARTARKIALLVLTNFVTFTIPMMFGVLQDDLWQNVFMEAFPKWQTLTLTDIQWVLFVLHALPALCFSINSILNPLIYALRHPVIKQHLNTNSVSVQQS